jgi:hypothetical protein
MTLSPLVRHSVREYGAEVNGRRLVLQIHPTD